MTRRPPIHAERRWIGLLALVVIALGQAGTMIVTAFATRDVFMTLRDGTGVVPTEALVSIALAGLALFALRSVEGAVGEKTGQSYVAALRRRLFLHMSKMPASALARRRSGSIALRYVGDLAAFKGWVARGLARLISASITIPAAFLILYLLEPLLALAAAVPIAMIMVAILWLGEPLGTAHSRLRNRRARLAAAMAERLPQGIALRRSGRIKTELKSLSDHSGTIASASVWRAWLAETVRALPDAGAGVAGALCLWLCLTLNLTVADAVAALTALAMVVWPLRHLADVRDRHKAYAVAAGKLEKLLAAPRMAAPPKSAPAEDGPALRIEEVDIEGKIRSEVALPRGQLRRLSGPAGCGKSRFLLIAAGFEASPKGTGVEVLGTAPEALSSGHILYLGPHTPTLKGTLRREATLGIGRKADDDEIMAAFERADLKGLVDRLGGLSGQVAEGRRNLSARENVGLHLVRGLLARPDLALVDADEIGLDDKALAHLIDHLAETGAAALIVTEQPETALRLGAPVVLTERAEVPRQAA